PAAAARPGRRRRGSTRPPPRPAPRRPRRGRAPTATGRRRAAAASAAGSGSAGRACRPDASGRGRSPPVRYSPPPLSSRRKPMAETTPTYDLMLLLRASLDEEQRAQIRADIEQMVVDQGGVIELTQEWGVRGTAYEIG